MNLPHISYTNSKGQIVIPQAARKATGIKPNSPVSITIKDSGVYIQPIHDIVTPVSEEKSYLEILRKTAGAWGPASKEEIAREKKYKARERRAALESRKAW